MAWIFSYAKVWSSRRRHFAFRLFGRAVCVSMRPPAADPVTICGRRPKLRDFENAHTWQAV